MFAPEGHSAFHWSSADAKPKARVTAFSEGVGRFPDDQNTTIPVTFPAESLLQGQDSETPLHQCHHQKSRIVKLDPKWVPERAKHRGSKT